MTQVSARPRNMRRIAAAVTVVATALAVLFVVLSLDFSRIVPTLRELRPATLLIVTLCLVVNLLFAYFRFERTLAAFGAVIHWRAGAHAFVFGGLAGQLLLNIIGQSLTRAMVLQSAGVPMGLTVVATYVERLIALGVLGVAAVVSALILFGSVGFQVQEGGAYFLSLGIGLAAVLGIAGVRAAASVLTREHLRNASATAIRLVPVLVLTVLVHATMFAAYLALALDFSSGVDMMRLAAALVLIMFAAAMPISWAGWGLREFGAVYALNAVGMPSEAAVIVAVTIGALSLILALVMALIAWADSWRRPVVPAAAENAAARVLPPADAILYWSIGILAACLIYFQLRIPTGAGALTVNVADPLAITAVFFAAWLAIKDRFLARFAKPVLYAMAGLGMALLLGALVAWLGVGLTRWALVNRLFGFFIILGYLAIPGLAIHAAGERGRRIVADAFVLSAALICGVEIAAYLINLYVVPLPVDFFGFQFGNEGQLEGYAQNPNAFAFQLLMALSVLVAFHPPRWRRPLPTWSWLGLGALLAALLLSRSRAGMLAGVIAMVLALLPGRIPRRLLAGRKRLILLFAVVALAIVLGIEFRSAIYTLVIEPFNAHFRGTANESDQLHWQTTTEGLLQWWHHPLFGQGLGSFLWLRQQAHLPELVVHSVPIWFLAEMGLVGFAAYVFFLAALVGQAAQGHASGHLRRGLLVAIAIFACMGLFHDIFYQRTFWFGVGLLLTAASVAKDAAPPDRARR
jgi:O-antigen ligase